MQRSTETTRPRIFASSPMMGSWTGLCGISQTWPPPRLNVLTVAPLVALTSLR